MDKIKIALTGASGNMGERLFANLLPEDYVEEIRILDHDKKGTKAILKANKKYLSKVKVFIGSLIDKSVVKELVNGVDYVINLAAAIPPESDKHPDHAIEANEKGVKTLIEVIEEIKEHQPKLIHTSTVGLYGDRCDKHLYGEVGDPLLISPFDIYALTKMRGEFMVLESNIKNWTVIRQTAMLYDKMLAKNIDDGLMFHTCVNSPLEWSTARTSAVLYRNIIRADVKGELNNDNFWKHCFNLTGGEKSRITGYETVELGFKMIGATFYQFFEPNYNATRNFHGLWYSDGYKLENMFHYIGENAYDFWDNVAKQHKLFALGKIVPKKLLKAFIIKPLLEDNNAPMYWYKHHDEARMIAYFGGVKQYENLPKKWDDFNILCKGKDLEGNKVDYEYLRTHPTRLNHFFDIDKPRSELNIDDLNNVAEAHGGKLITKEFKKGDIFKKVEWETQDGERFIATPHTVLYCGHWYNISYKEHAWDFDRLSKKDKIYAQIWYDRHDQNENNYYYFDDKFNAYYKKIGE